MNFGSSSASIACRATMRTIMTRERIAAARTLVPAVVDYNLQQQQTRWISSTTIAAAPAAAAFFPSSIAAAPAAATTIAAAPASASHLLSSTKALERFVEDSVMDKEFPGYFDSDHQEHHRPEESYLDVQHDKTEQLMKDISARMDAGPLITCEKVTKLLENHPQIDECVTIDIDVHQQGKLIPVAFVTKRLGSEGHDDEGLKGKILNAVHQILDDDNRHRHQELERDLMRKFEDFFDQSDVKDDLIMDSLINLIHDEFQTSHEVKIVVVDDIPRTICGKILKGTMLRISRGESYEINPMIESRETLKKVEKEIQKLLSQQQVQL